EGVAGWVTAFILQSRSPEIIVEHQRDGDHDRDHRDHDMVPLQAWEWCVRSFHCARSLAASRFSMVVFASHSLPRGTLLRCFATKPRRLKKSCALSLTSAVNWAAPRDDASFASASMSMVPAPRPAAAG